MPSFFGAPDATDTFSIEYQSEHAVITINKEVHQGLVASFFGNQAIWNDKEGTCIVSRLNIDPEAFRAFEKAAVAAMRSTSLVNSYIASYMRSVRHNREAKQLELKAARIAQAAAYARKSAEKASTTLEALRKQLQKLGADYEQEAVNLAKRMQSNSDALYLDESEAEEMGPFPTKIVLADEEFSIVHVRETPDTLYIKVPPELEILVAHVFNHPRLDAVVNAYGVENIPLNREKLQLLTAQFAIRPF